MANFIDIQKNAHEKGILLDGCGTDERYYNFGSFMDFCGTKPQDLMPKCCCDGNGGGSSTGGTTTLPQNTIASTIENKASGYEVTITSQNPVASDIEVTVTYAYTVGDVTEDASETFLFEKDSLSKSYALAISNSATNVYVKNIELNPEEDEKYKYATEPIVNLLTYCGVFISNNIDSMTESDVENMQKIICQKGKNDISFDIPAVGINGLNNIENEDEVNQILMENAYDLIIAYNSKISNYEIVDPLNNNDDKFIFYKEITIGNEKYYLLRRNDPNTQRNVYDSAYEAPASLLVEYSFIINEIK